MSVRRSRHVAIVRAGQHATDFGVRIGVFSRCARISDVLICGCDSNCSCIDYLYIDGC